MKVYFLLVLFLFFWIGLPKQTADGLRSCSVAALAPSWKWAKGVQKYLSDRPGVFRTKNRVEEEELKRLRLENRTLRLEMEKMSHWFVAEARLQNQMDLLKGLTRELTQAEEERWRTFFQRRVAHLRDLMQWELMAIPAQVIYRDPVSWSSSIWVNVGEESNRNLGSAVIAKNSPVISGDCLVGVVDYVGKRQSRIRLITDSGLAPAVRAVRQSKYLAKGEIHGSSFPFWRSRSLLLNGIGFNFDYPDAEGAAQLGVPIIQEGDLLVTSGLDGVFPPDLRVGKVVKVGVPKPGRHAYDIEAEPLALSMNDLEMLFILPPVND